LHYEVRWQWFATPRDTSVGGVERSLLRYMYVGKLLRPGKADIAGDVLSHGPLWFC